MWTVTAGDLAAAVETMQHVSENLQGCVQADDEHFGKAVQLRLQLSIAMLTLMDLAKGLSEGESDVEAMRKTITGERKLSPETQRIWDEFEKVRAAAGDARFQEVLAQLLAGGNRAAR